MYSLKNDSIDHLVYEESTLPTEEDDIIVWKQQNISIQKNNKIYAWTTVYIPSHAHEYQIHEMSKWLYQEIIKMPQFTTYGQQKDYWAQMLQENIIFHKHHF